MWETWGAQRPLLANGSHAISRVGALLLWTSCRRAALGGVVGAAGAAAAARYLSRKDANRVASIRGIDGGADCDCWATVGDKDAPCNPKFGVDGEHVATGLVGGSRADGGGRGGSVGGLVGECKRAGGCRPASVGTVVGDISSRGDERGEAARAATGASTGMSCAASSTTAWCAPLATASPAASKATRASVLAASVDSSESVSESEPSPSHPDRRRVMRSRGEPWGNIGLDDDDDDCVRAARADA